MTLTNVDWTCVLLCGDEQANINMAAVMPCLLLCSLYGLVILSHKFFQRKEIIDFLATRQMDIILAIDLSASAVVIAIRHSVHEIN